MLLMEAHHESISAQLDEVIRLRTPYAAAAGETAKLELAGACERLNSLLIEHLGAEEQRLLPLAEQHMTSEEWGKIGEEGLGTLPKRMMPLAFGMMQYEGDPETLAEMIGGAPFPIRHIVPALARRTFRKCAWRVHGTETPDAKTRNHGLA